jgi:hypothetical protein
MKFIQLHDLIISTVGITRGPSTLHEYVRREFKLAKKVESHRPALNLYALHFIAGILARPSILKFNKSKPSRLVGVIVSRDVHVPDFPKLFGDLLQVLSPATVRIVWQPHRLASFMVTKRHNGRG